MHEVDEVKKGKVNHTLSVMPQRNINACAWKVRTSNGSYSTVRPEWETVSWKLIGVKQSSGITEKRKQLVLALLFSSRLAAGGTSLRSGNELTLVGVYIATMPISPEEKEILIYIIYTPNHS